MTRPAPLSRRTALFGLAASACPFVARAQTGTLAALGARAGRFAQLHALVVARDSRTVFAEAFRGPSLDTEVNVKSVSKTIVAALTGAAIDRGVLPGLEARLGTVAPGLIPPGADPRVAAITVENLVTLQAGLDRTSGRNYGAWVNSGNWLRYALTRDFVAEPGGGMLYSTGTTHVLGAVLTETTGRSLHDLANAWLGRPLGIAFPAWTRDPQGYYLGGNNMAMSPRGMIRFGEMYRRDGRFDGRQVLSRGWVRDSFRARGASPWSGMGYGLGWFLDRADGADYALARGYGGQVICVVPARGLTIAITSDPNRPARSQGYFGALRRLIEDDLIAAFPA